MPRTRQLHPEFFRHEDLGELSPLHRLLFQGMWCEADREGRLEDRPRRLKATWLPYDEADGDELVNDLAAGGHIVRYEVGDQKLLVIPSFGRWQKVHPSEKESDLPAPPPEVLQIIKQNQRDSTRSEKVLHVEDQGASKTIRNLPLSSFPSLPSLSSCPPTPAAVAADESPPDLQRQFEAAGMPVPTPDPKPADLQRLWNTIAFPVGLPKWRDMPEPRRKAAEARLAERPLTGETGWQAVIERVARSNFCRGGGAQGWKLTPKFLLKPDTATRVLEGDFDDRASATGRDLANHAANEYELAPTGKAVT